MNRRLISLAAVTGLAAASVLVVAPRGVRASGIVGGTATYRLTSDSDIPVPDPNATAPQVVARVVPPGTVVPTKQDDGSEASPLTILKTSTGFDQSQLIVALKDNLSNSTASPEQLFGLSFFGTGFHKDGQLDFSLSLDNSVTTPPQLQSLTPGVSIVSLSTDTPTTNAATPDPSSGTRGRGDVAVPEPMSMVIWSAVVGFGVMRARLGVFRRRPAV